MYLLLCFLYFSSTSCGMTTFSSFRGCYFMLENKPNIRYSYTFMSNLQMQHAAILGLHYIWAKLKILFTDVLHLDATCAVRASIYSQGIYLLTWHSDTFDHMNVFVWLHAEYSCAHMMSIHVLTWLSAWLHVFTCHMACIHMKTHASIYMTPTIFHQISNFPVFPPYRALMVGVPKRVFSYKL